MLGGDHHKGGPENGVGAGREDLQCSIVTFHVEADEGTGRLPDPIHLLSFEAFTVVHFGQIGQQPFGVGGDPQAPLQHRALLYRVVAAFAPAILHLVVGQHGAQRFAPVYVANAAEGQPVIHQDVALCLFVEPPKCLGGQLKGFGLNGLQTVRSLRFQVCDQVRDGPGFIRFQIVPVVEDFPDDPLRPFKIARVGGIDAAVPIEA